MKLRGQIFFSFSSSSLVTHCHTASSLLPHLPDTFLESGYWRRRTQIQRKMRITLKIMLKSKNQLQKFISLYWQSSVSGIISCLCSSSRYCFVSASPLCSVITSGLFSTTELLWNSSELRCLATMWVIPVAGVLVGGTMLRKYLEAQCSPGFYQSKLHLVMASHSPSNNLSVTCQTMREVRGAGKVRIHFLRDWALDLPMYLPDLSFKTSLTWL